MPFGEYVQPKDFLLRFPNGAEKDLKLGGEYFSMFIAKTYIVNKEYQAQTGQLQEVEIPNALSYFRVIGNGEKYIDEIHDLVVKHCRKHLFPHLSESEQKRLFAGFGGDCMAGLIDCHSSKPLEIECIPDITFEIEGHHYRMEWHYYEGEEDE